MVIISDTGVWQKNNCAPCEIYAEGYFLTASAWGMQ